MSVLLSLAIVIPAAGALAAHAGRRHPLRPRQVALCVLVLQLAVGVMLWFLYDARGDEWQFVEDRGLPVMALRYALGLDGLSLTMVILTALAGLLAVSWSPSAALSATDRHRRYAAVLLMQASLTGVFLALDTVLLMVFWLASLTTVWLLASRTGLTHRSRTTMAIVVVTAAAASVAAMAALVSHYASLATFVTFDLRPLLRLPLAASHPLWIFGGLVLACVVTALVLPLVIELPQRPDANTVVPDWIALVMMSGLVKLGAYGVLRVALPVLPEAARTLRPALVGLSLAIALACGLLALRQSCWRRTIACASSSHASLAFAGAFSLTPAAVTGSIVLLVTHTLALCALFIATRPADRRLTSAATAGFVLAMVILAGVPAFAGFVAFRELLPGVSIVSREAAIVAALATLLTAAGAARMWSKGRVTPGEGFSTTAEAYRPATMASSIAVAMVALAVGVYPAPLLWRIETPVARLVLRVSPEYAADVADCLKPRTAPLPPPGDGLPAGMGMAAPCADGSAPASAPAKK